jgi:hypothetical protein
MGDHAGEPAVVGEKQKPLGVDVEPADGDDPGQFLGQVVEHRGAALRVAGRGHEAARLVVEPQARTLLCRQRLAIHGDLVGRRHIDGRAVEYLAVESHAAFGDHGFHVAAGRDAGAGDHLGDPVLDGLLRLRRDLGLSLILAGRPHVGTARTVVARPAAEGTITFGAPITFGALGSEWLVAFIAARADGAISAFGTGAERFVAVAAAERLVSGLAGLARAVIVLAGVERAIPARARFAKGPVTRGAGSVGASRRAALTIIVIAVGHEGLIAEERKRSEGHG